MSSETVVTLNSMSVTSKSIQECPSPFTYEAAMEALSSLITRKKRDGYSNPNVKYKKLERMSMYIQVRRFSIEIITFRWCFSWI